jgi:hypothetical protein
VFLEKDDGTAAGDEEDSGIAQGTLDSSPNEATMCCAVGKNCKEPDVPLMTDEFKCFVCK